MAPGCFNPLLNKPHDSADDTSIPSKNTGQIKMPAGNRKASQQHCQSGESGFNASVVQGDGLGETKEMMHFDDF
ncbi:uncharacterized protein MELLADRAFT_56579 [Melampsora larici-populina 98AG31]|uniref:Uncharacterized protein n=1 Tax=Melampsora larici-populina (strain 98AG31 / pathotype 3-4-7) TaxID=747676 RepID=F4RS61_MELLP|nr:uncharacterized protein MELLADRAFT_56579 [Melampsora larici-populina 98AG31]EGG04799.1 hypothetical protein MELLADRAFT_56579 [Melampsora larici-populina 98AG31]